MIHLPRPEVSTKPDATVQIFHTLSLTVFSQWYTVWLAIGIILSSDCLSVCDTVHCGTQGRYRRLHSMDSSRKVLDHQADNTSATRTFWRPHWRRAASLTQNLSRMQLRELHGDHCARKEFKTLKPVEFSPYRRSAAVESLEPLQPPLDSDATYAVMTASPESAQTTTSLTRRSVVSTAQSNQSGGCKLYHHVPKMALPIYFFRHFHCRMYGLATEQSKLQKSRQASSIKSRLLFETVDK